ncbi:MAG TPA: TadE/TadG family type IV pilus assembly protein [Dehalococcoidia bacterium]|nr:TadE/TadG family type IV pilus assembly protein [Dehalococcoidia bacterium]
MMRRLTDHRGQSLVEFAVVAPVFLMIVLGLVDGARAVWHYNTLAQATREGTRYAIVRSGATASQIESVVREHASGLDQNDLTVTVSFPDGDSKPGDRVDVRASYRFDPLFDLVGLPGITMTSSSRMTIQH